MPSQNPQSPAPSPFEIVTSAKSNKGGKKGVIVTILIAVFLLLSVVAGVLLVRNNQNVSEKAQTASGSCPNAQACPVAGQPYLLRNCTPPEGDNSPAESRCNVVGRVEVCGGAQYCCPAAGGAWTTNMTACTATASPVATATATATATAAATSTPRATATPLPTLAPASRAPTAQRTSLPIPITGTGWPTYVGAGVGIVVIIASILIAL